MSMLKQLNLNITVLKGWKIIPWVNITDIFKRNIRDIFDFEKKKEKN